MTQSAKAKSPIGVTLFWDNEPQPMVWEKWLSTSKLPIVERYNIQEEKLLRPRLESEELRCTYEPLYEPPTSDETTAKKRKCDQRNINCRGTGETSEDKGPFVDNMPWDEANTKIKSLIYLLFGQEATNIVHQRNPHTEMPNCTIEAFVEQLNETFKEVRNQTFDRYQVFNCKKEQNEPLKKKHSRIKQKAALCN